ncbi:hypothetical protein GJ744_000350 [Endocarpon pusillum]|uniref:Uncharacterized protein n=1 Tax=Endocarpon pusillum TaxID=364733 RepID=A0A8H7APA2_9EURO|nr:hypothetical protein GJ744_000350 [Endocarpon pusillum]
MAPAFDKCPTRPAHIDAILNGLDRYNPETTTIFQDYVSSQCEEKTFDAYACLALLKLYVSSSLLSLPHAQAQCDEQEEYVSYYPSPPHWRAMENQY